MSGEQLTVKESSIASTEKLQSRRVNINHLLEKVREEKNKEKKENYMFLGLVVGVLAITGIIVSL